MYTGVPVSSRGVKTGEFARNDLYRFRLVATARSKEAAAATKGNTAGVVGNVACRKTENGRI